MIDADGMEQGPMSGSLKGLVKVATSQGRVICHRKVLLLDVTGNRSAPVLYGYQDKRAK
jgi:hypothetical protein